VKALRLVPVGILTIQDIPRSIATNIPFLFYLTEECFSRDSIRRLVRLQLNVKCVRECNVVGTAELAPLRNLVNKATHSDASLGQLYTRQIGLHPLGFSIGLVGQRRRLKTVNEVKKSVGGRRRAGSGVERLDARRPHWEPSTVKEMMEDSPPSEISFCEMRIRVRLRGHGQLVNVLVAFAANNWEHPQELLGVLFVGYRIRKMSLKRG